MIVPYTHVLLLAAVLFAVGMLCVVLRRNLMMILIGLEIMLKASAVAFVGGSLHNGQMEGQAVTLFILAVAAAEVAVGLTLIVCIYRQTHTVSPQCVEENACRLE